MSVDSKRTILLVEDEAIIAITGQRLLENYGYSVITANSGEKAVDAVEKYPHIDLILMDINLGNGIDGTSAAQIILAKHDLPLIFLSSHTERDIVEKTEGITSYGYVVKNSGITVLDASIKMAFKLFNSKKKEEEKDQFLKDIITKNPMSIQILDKDGFTLEVNPSFKLLFGSVPPADYSIFNDTQLEKQGTIEIIDRLRNGEIIHFPDVYFNVHDSIPSLPDVPVWVHTIGFPLNSNNDKAEKFVLMHENISARRMAEKTLKVSELKFSKLFDMNPSACGLSDMESRKYIEVNNAFCNLLGFSREEVIGKTVFDLDIISPEISKTIFLKADKNGCLNNAEAALKAKNGNIKHVLLSTANIEVEGEHFRITVVNDVTDRKLAEDQLQKANEELNASNEEFQQINEEFEAANEELICSQNEIISRETALRESEKSLKQQNDLFSVLLKNLSQGVFMVEAPSGKPILANDAAQKILGRGILPDANFQNLSEVYEAFRVNTSVPYPPEEMPIIMGMNGKSTHIDDMMVKRPDGTTNYLEVYGTPIFDPDGKIWASLVSFSDITERKLVEKALRENEKDLTETQKIAHIGNWRLDLATNEVVWSEELYKMYGFNPSLPPPPYTEHQKLFTPESWELLSSSLTGAMETGIPYELELKTVREDSRNGWMWVRGEAVLDENGKITGLWGAAQDITERKLAEEEIKHQLIEKEILLKEVHHRIKNNIGSIEGLLSMQLQEISNPDAVSALQDAIGRVSSMRVLYDRLLIGNDYKDTSVKNYIESLITAVVSLFPYNLIITTEMKIDDFTLETKNLFSLGIILNELLTNIMKYAFRGRESGLINISLLKINNQVTLTIQDNGVGLPEDFDIDKSNGFGLMLVSMLSEQLGGVYAIENHNGTRSVLKFEKV